MFLLAKSLSNQRNMMESHGMLQNHFKTYQRDVSVTPRFVTKFDRFGISSYNQRNVRPNQFFSFTKTGSGEANCCRCSNLRPGTPVLGLLEAQMGQTKAINGAFHKWGYPQIMTFYSQTFFSMFVLGLWI